MKKYIVLTFVLFLVSLQSYSQQNRNDVAGERVFENPLSAPFISVWDKVPEEIKNTNAFKRFEWFYGTRLNEYEDFPVEHFNQQKAIELQKAEENSDVPESNSWTNIGPKGIDMAGSQIASHWGTVSGRIRGLCIHPANSDIVYTGAAAGGIWKTTNGGISWEDKSSGLNMLTFGAIAIDSSNPNTVYAGTGESRWGYNFTTFEGDGLYKSTNGGDSWQRITDGFGSRTQFSDIVVSPSNPNIIIASISAAYTNNQNPGNQGIWRSTNAGINWTRVKQGSGVFDIAFHPTDGNIAYAAIGDQRSSGFFISTDAGLSWVNSNTGLPAESKIARMQFDISKSNPSIIYCVIYNNKFISGNRRTCAYKSTNGGESWSQISTGVNIAGYSGTKVLDQGGYDLCIAVNPVDPQTVFFGNVELSKTINGSNISFVRNPNGYYQGKRSWDSWTHVDIHIIKYSPSNPNIIYIGCDGGVYKSTNGGGSFFHVNNEINAIQFYRVASHPLNPGILYGGAQDNGNFKTNDQGNTNWKFTTTGDGMECFVDYSSANRVFISTQYGWLNRSTDNGVSFTRIFTAVDTSTAWTAPFWQHPGNAGIIFAAVNRRLYRSTNYGTNWAIHSNNFTNTSGYKITSVSQSTVNHNNMMAVSYSSASVKTPRVYKSTNGGQTFANLNFGNMGFSPASILKVAAHPSDANTFFILRGSYNTGQVLKTTNFGTNWTDISSDLPKVAANDIYIDSQNNDYIFIANDLGVYRTANAGTTWRRLGDPGNFPFVPVMDFGYSQNGSTRLLRAATHGRGVYEIDLSTVHIPITGTNIPGKFDLSQNYPNPFNPVTNIDFDISVKANVNIKVYDISGREISTLMDEFTNAGKYSLTFNGTDLSSGTYFLKMLVNGGREYSSVKKMLLLK